MIYRMDTRGIFIFTTGRYNGGKLNGLSFKLYYVGVNIYKYVDLALNNVIMIRVHITTDGRCFVPKYTDYIYLGNLE